jgi:N-acetylglucosaminyldiphosphoundecaprenol N-acetyl-beta-D-mannosaminyltransferase
MLDKTTILAVGITTSPKSQILEFVAKFLEQKKPSVLTIVTPNPEQIVLAQTAEEFREILNKAGVALPDGAGLVWAIKKSSVSLNAVKRIGGIDFMNELAVLAGKNNYAIGLVGGWGRRAEESLIELKSKYLNLNGWAQEGPEFKISNNQISIINSEENFENYIKQLAQHIKQTKTRMVFIALGAPKQEYFMAELVRHYGLIANHDSLVIMIVGGAFDILSGGIKRAPKTVQNLNLEWLWRLIQEPWRIGRQMKLLQFIKLVMASKNS